MGWRCGSTFPAMAQPMSRAERGFTLIEMLVALAIFSIAALALLRLEGVTLTGTQRLADTNMAQIVARNLAVSILTDPRGPAIGAENGAVVNAGQSWRWTRITTRTDDARVVRVDLSVADQSGRPMTRLSLARAVE